MDFTSGKIQHGGERHFENWFSAVRHCSDVSKNRFDLVITIGQTFGHATLPRDTNGLLNVNGRNIVRDLLSNTL